MTMCIPVLLSKSEMLAASCTGSKRQIEALSRNLPDRHGFDGSGGHGWAIHIEGSCGELAVARAVGIQWDGTIGTFKTGYDVGKYQVRTRSKHHYDLIVRDDDRDEDIFILVTGSAPAYRVQGWCYGWEAKNPEYLQTYGDREPAYFVPQAKLHPMGELPR